MFLPLASIEFFLTLVTPVNLNLPYFHVLYSTVSTTMMATVSTHDKERCCYKEIERKGPFQINGDLKLMKRMDKLLRKFVDQQSRRLDADAGVVERTCMALVEDRARVRVVEFEREGSNMLHIFRLQTQDIFSPVSYTISSSFVVKFPDRTDMTVVLWGPLKTMNLH